MKKKLTIDQRRAIYCVVNGHSKVVETYFGYVYCARCRDKIGDIIIGSFDGKNVVIVGHACKICKTNFKKLSKKDLVHVPRKKLDGYNTRSV